MTELKQLTETIDKMGRAWEEMKGSIADKVKQETKGAVDVLLQEKMAKLNEALSDLDTKKVSLENLLKAASRPVTLDAKGKLIPEDQEKVIASYNGFIRKGVVDKRETKEFSHEEKSMSVISDSDGGFTVTADINGRIVKRIFETSPVRQFASVQTIGTDALEGLFDLGEGSAGWVSETGARPATDTPQIGKWRISVHEMYANLQATQKLLDDSNVDIEQWLSEKTADKFARLENTAFVLGDGNGKPRGFMTYADGTTLPGTIEQIVSGAATTITYAGLNNLQFALKDYYRARAAWAMNRSTLGVVRGLVDGFGRPLWEPSLQIGTPSRLLGMEIAEFNDMAALGAGTLSIALADWKEFYQIVDRAGIRVLRDPYTNKPFVIFYSTKRVGGDVLNFEAGKILRTAAA